MRVMRAVWQMYTPNRRSLWLMEVFRQMLNDCIRIGLANNLTSLNSLSLHAYSQLSRYDIPSVYKSSAISKATGILRHYRKAKRKNPQVKEPYVHRLHLTSGYALGFEIQDGVLQIPHRPHRHNVRLTIPLNQHTLQVLGQPRIIIHSFVLTHNRVGVSYSKDVDEIKTQGLLGIDSNVENLTTADTEGTVDSYSLVEAARVKARYREVKSHLRRNDMRIRRRIWVKYAWKEQQKVKHILHNTSKVIVTKAKDKQYGIVMEKLTGIRKLYRRGNGQSRRYRARMNSWSFAELQRQIEYKARWAGLPVIYVDPYGTSSKCSICGHKMVPEENRKLRCPSCGYIVDRDVNAAKNILARGMRFVPFAPAIEAMVQEPVHQQVILKVDAGESSPRES